MSRIAGLAVLAVLMALVAACPARAAVPEPPKTPTVQGWGGSAASIDPLATQTAVDVLRSGGNAVDAAVAAAGVLGVTEPFSCGIGGGGFMVIYDARHRRADTVDSREEAPAGMQPNAFEPYQAADQFTEARVGGLSVGVPGTVSGWETALRRFGTRPLRRLLRPAERIGREGFVIDPIFNGQVNDNKAIFDDFPATSDLYLTGGQAKPVNSVQTNPDLADTYRRIGDDPDRFYRGAIARDIAQTVQHPPKASTADHPAHPGSMTVRDLRHYRALRRDPTRVSYRGLDIFGMAPPSSGGSTVGEALNIMEALPRTADRTQVLHHYLEASKLAYADRDAYVADPAYFDVPLRGLLSDPFARERSHGDVGLIREDSTLPTPQAAGDPYPYDHGHGHGHPRSGTDENGKSTTHLTVADRWGNIVTYTFTIEQIGGSGMVVPGRGFLLNNELTDFNFTEGTANSPAPGKRPRSSMAPTLVFNHGRPDLALGSPGGATIITTVLQTLVNYIDLRESVPEAVREPRASQRNSEPTPAEPAFIDRYGPALTALGHSFSVVTPKPPAEIGAVSAIRFLPHGQQQAVAEPTRRGGGSAMVVHPG